MSENTKAVARKPGLALRTSDRRVAVPSPTIWLVDTASRTNFGQIGRLLAAVDFARGQPRRASFLPGAAVEG